MSFPTTACTLGCRLIATSYRTAVVRRLGAAYGQDFASWSSKALATTTADKERFFASQSDPLAVSITNVKSSSSSLQSNTDPEDKHEHHDHDHEHNEHHHDHDDHGKEKDGKVAVLDDEMEQEEMFVDPHESFDHEKREWGGPRRGGRLPEPTRYGDWERKGRCSDF